MARVVGGVIGPSHSDPESFATTALPAGFSVVSSPAPTGTPYRIKLTGDGSSHSSWDVNAGAASGTLQWRLFIYREEGTLTITTDVPFAQSSVELRRRRVTGSTYKIVVYNTVGAVELGVSSTTFDTGTDYRIRMQTDNTTFVMDVDGVDEVVAAYTLNLPNTVKIPIATVESGVSRYWNGFFSAASDSADYGDRPGGTINTYFLVPSSTVLEESHVYGQVGTGCPTAGEGSHADWDDWASGANDGGSTALRACGGNTGVEISRLTTATVANVENGIAITRTLSRAETGGKTIDWWHRIVDVTGSPGGAVELQRTNLTSTSYLLVSAPFRTAPDGGVWTQTDVNNVQAGVRTVSTNNDNEFHTAMGVEFGTCTNDGGIAPALGRPGARRMVQAI